MILAALAIAPCIALLIYIYKKDKLEKEPKGILIGLLGMSILSVLGASMLERLGAFVTGSNTVASYVVYYWIVVGGAEELCKYLPMKLLTWKSKEFNCRYDAVVYCVYISLGFALIENLMYVLTSDSGLSVALSRAFTSIPGHTAFAVLMGYYYGKAKAKDCAGDEESSKKLRRRAVLVPMCLHGFYDVLCFMMEYSGKAVIAFLAVVAAIYWICFKLTGRLSREDAYFVRPGMGYAPRETEVQTAPPVQSAPSGYTPAPMYVRYDTTAQQSGYNPLNPGGGQQYAQPAQQQQYAQPRQYYQPQNGQQQYAQQYGQVPSGQPVQQQYGQAQYSQPQYATRQNPSFIPAQQTNGAQQNQYVRYDPQNSGADGKE